MKISKIIALLTGLCLTTAMLEGCSDKNNKKGKADPAKFYNSQPVDTGYEWSNVKIVGGGYIPGIVYNETEKDLIYAKTDIGGAYKFNKDKNKWECITDSFGGEDWGYNCIESIATDPIEPNRVYMSCGTSYSGNGCIMYSYDYGKNWTKVDMGTITMGGNDWGRNTGERLCVDPNDNSIVYYASHSKGLFVSKDYGQSWSNVESFPSKGDFSEEGYRYGILWVTMDKSSSKKGEATKTFFCGVANKDTEQIYRTDDAGETWKAINNEFSVNAGIKYYPQQGRVSDNGNLYVTYSNMVTQEKNPPRGIVCRYNIKEGKWTDITPHITGNGWCGLSICNNDKYKGDMIAVTTICHWGSEDNVCVSFDGGDTWKGFWNIETEEKDYNLDISESPWLDWQGQLKIGWWTSGVAINPFNPDEILYGTGATIFGTDNATKIGQEKVNISVRAMGIEETAIFDFYSPKDCGENTPDLYSILGDLYGFRHDDVNTAPKEHWGAQSFKAESLAVAANDPDIVVRTTADSDFENSICYSTDGTKSWKFVKTIPDGVNINQGGTAYLSADGKVLFWSLGAMSVNTYYTTDWGKTWKVCKGLPANANIIPDQVNPDKIFAESGGTLFVSTDKGKTFKEFYDILISNSDIVANPEKEGDLWIAAGLVFHIENAGEEGCEMVAPNKDFQSVECIGLGKGEKDGDPEAIYIIGENNNNGEGVYRSTDGGKTWKRINDDTQRWGNVNNKISGDPKTFGRVYISTNGRGIIMGNPAK